MAALVYKHLLPPKTLRKFTGVCPYGLGGGEANGDMLEDELQSERAGREGLSGVGRQPLSDEAFLRTMVDAIRDYAIFALDARGFVLSWNAGAERITGYRAGEIVGQHFSRFYPPEEAEAGRPGRELEMAA